MLCKYTNYLFKVRGLQKKIYIKIKLDSSYEKNLISRIIPKEGKCRNIYGLFYNNNPRRGVVLMFMVLNIKIKQRTQVVVSCFGRSSVRFYFYTILFHI